MEDPLALIWNHIADAIRPEVSGDTFQRWFKAIQLLGADEAQITLRVPNNIYQLWIETNYMGLLQSSILKVLGSPRKVRFTIADTQEKAEEAAEEPDAKSTSRPISAAQEKAAPTPANGMNPRNTFDSFVVGTNNQFAHAAALAVAQNPAKTYNPLFVYGGVGLGKTHLMHAIGQHVATTKKGAKVMYLSSEKFTNEFIDAIQFLAGKERSQEEFFHTFNTLFDGHKQIILSSDRPPSEIQNLEARLVSRFEWGLTAELQPPDIETRMAILRKKAQLLKIKLDPAVFEFLAERIKTNVRRLEGALMRVASFASLSGRELTPDAVEHLLKDILQEEARRTVTIEQIQRKVAEHYDVRLADMTSKRRPANIAFPRQVAMYLSRELTKTSLSEIGDAFGGRDHGTVLHAHRLVKERMVTDEKVRQVVTFLDNQLNR